MWPLTTDGVKDFKLVKELGINFLRYGPRYYSTHLGRVNTIGSLQKPCLKSRLVAASPP